MPACVYFCMTRGFNMAEVIITYIKNYQYTITNATKKQNKTYRYIYSPFDDCKEY